MTDTKEFKAALARRGTTAAELAVKIGLSPQSLSYKINNQREFTLSELQKIKNALILSAEEVIKIFFASDGE